MADINERPVKNRLGVWDNEARWVRFPSWLGALVGVWLVIAPFVLGYDTNEATVNSIVVGVVAIAVSAWSAMTYSTIPNWLHAVAGVWLMIAPFVLDYGGIGEIENATRNDLATGAGFIGLHIAIAMGKMAVDRLGASRVALEGRGIGPEERIVGRKAA
jgi:hypothetical protein